MKNTAVVGWIKDFTERKAKADALLIKPDFNAEDEAAVKSLNEEMKSFKGRIEAAKDTETLGAFLTVGDYLNPGNGTNAQVLGSVSTAANVANVSATKDGLFAVDFDRLDPALARSIKAARTVEYKSAFRSYLFSGGQVERMGVDAMKALQEGSDSLGGFTVPEDMLNLLIQKKPAPTVLSGKVTSLQTSRDSLTIPRSVYNADDIYTTGIRVTKTGENPTSATQSQANPPQFGTVKIPVQTWMLSLPITNDLIEDSAFPLETWIASKFDETVNLLIENQIMNGSGVGENLGILPAIARGAADDPKFVKTGDAAKLTPDSLFALKRAVPPQYTGNMAFAMNYGSAGLQVETMKDAQNRYLFRMGGPEDGGLQGDSPDALIGKPIAYCQFMPDVAAGVVPVVYGDMTGYYLLRRLGFSIQVLREVGALQNQIILVGRVRFGGQPVDSWKIKGLKVAA